MTMHLRPTYFSALAGRFAARRLAWLLLFPLVAQAEQTCSVFMLRERAESRYEAVAGAVPPNSEVRDKVTQLVWQRCAAGMEWNDTAQICQLVGAATYPTVATWTGALEIARNAPRSAVAGALAWRLPSHAELYSLPDRACFGPALNILWFPNDPASWFWTSSSNRALSNSAWIVNTYNGEDFVNSKDTSRMVRLVR